MFLLATGDYDHISQLERLFEEMSCAVYDSDSESNPFDS